MDLRIQKTRKNIINAFMELRTKKKLEKITIRELAEVAVINKATFYLHFKDIYDLSDYIEDEIIKSSLQKIGDVDALFTKNGVLEFANILYSQSGLFDIIFSGTRIEVMIQKIEIAIKQQIFCTYPELKHDFSANVLLSAEIWGIFHTFLQYRENNKENVLQILSEYSIVDTFSLSKQSNIKNPSYPQT